MASVALIGASGNVGSRILKELSERGHQVTAIARHPDTIPTLEHVTVKQGDAADQQALTELIRGHDVVISSIRFIDAQPEVLFSAVEASGVKRYIVVGGAATLEVSPGERLLDQPNFPDAYRPEATKGAEFFEKLQQRSNINWTFISPSAEFFAGERTGKFRLGKDMLLTNENGSRISYEDFAIALVDEIEHPQHERARFTVGY